MNELHQRWQVYDTRVIPKDAPYAQQVETKRAYYAGAQAVVDLLLRSDTKDQTLRDLVEQIKDFQADERVRGGGLVLQ